MAEIDETELARLRGAERLMNELNSSVKTKRDFQRQVKQLHPDYVSEEDAAKPFVEDAKSAAAAVLGEHLKKTKGEAIEADFEAKLDSYRLVAKQADGN